MNPAAFCPETLSPLDEYYTPSILADAVCPLRPNHDGTTDGVQALEPSAGIGHLFRAFSSERKIADAGSRQQGTFNLIVSNPPYSERGAAALEDPDASPGPGATACKSAHSEDDA